MNSQTATAMSSVDEFTLEIAADRSRTYDTLLYRGRVVTAVEARVVEAQFRLADGSTLVLLNDDEPFKETLTLVLVGPGLDVLDRLVLGGAFTPGYLTYAYPLGPDEVAFCWHDLDQVVTVRRVQRWFGLRPSWLRVRELAVQPPRQRERAAGADPALRVHMAARPRWVSPGRTMAALAWAAWLRVRTVRFGREQGGRSRRPRR